MDINRSLATRELLFGCILLVFGYVRLVDESTKGENLLESGLNGKILDSTVQIRIYSQGCACTSLGLGTVVKIEEKHYVLTHRTVEV